MIQASQTRMFDTAVFSKKAFCSRGDTWVFEHQIRVHSVEHAVNGRLELGSMLEASVLDDAAHIGETSGDLLCPHYGIGYVKAIENIGHILPAFKRQQRATLRKRDFLLGGLFSITIKRFIKVDDTAGLAKGLNEEWVIGPSGPRYFSETNTKIIEK